MLPRRACGIALVAAVVLPLLAGCGDDSTTPSAKGTVRIEASFYPLAWMAEQVGGGHVTVKSLTEPGAEPHDLELTPADVAAVSDADLVVYLSGFQPAVDEAVAEAGDVAQFDAKPSADLDLSFTPIEEDKKNGDEVGSIDPHFWLDPTRFVAVAEAFSHKLSEVDPSNSDEFKTNLAELTDQLKSLDRGFKAGLASCANKDLVTSHNAFGYLARRYGLTQVGITGLTPEEEPSPSDLAAVSKFVEAHHVTTIYFENLVSPDIAKAVADEAGVATEVLDPIEGLNDQSQGKDYLEVMGSDLANLRKGQSCS